MQSIHNPQSAALSVVIVPVWVRLTIVSLVGVLFLISAAMLVMSVLIPVLSHWAQPAADFASVAGTGLLVLLILFFVQSTRSRKAIDDLTEDFLSREIPRALVKLGYDKADFVNWREQMRPRPPLRSLAKLRIAYSQGAYKADYILTLGEGAVRLKVEFNVRRLGVVYSVAAKDGETAQSVFSALTDTFAGARHAGYETSEAYEVAGVSEPFARELGCTRCVSHTLHRNLDPDFIYDEAQRLFIAQDLSIMTRSLMAERGLAPYGA